MNTSGRTAWSTVRGNRLRNNPPRIGARREGGHLLQATDRKRVWPDWRPWTRPGGSTRGGATMPCETESLRRWRYATVGAVLMMGAATAALGVMARVKEIQAQRQETALREQVAR